MSDHAPAPVQPAATGESAARLTEAERWSSIAAADGWDDVSGETLMNAAAEAIAWSLLDQTMDVSDREPSAELVQQGTATGRRILAARLAATGDGGLRSALLKPEVIEAAARAIKKRNHAAAVYDFHRWDAEAAIRAALAAAPEPAPTGQDVEHARFVSPDGQAEPWCAIDGQLWPCPDAPHDCATCTDCIHNGHKCCGCYDNSCCQTLPDVEAVRWVNNLRRIGHQVRALGGDDAVRLGGELLAAIAPDDQPEVTP